MELHGTIQDGKLMLSAVQRRWREQFLADMKNGQQVKEVLTKKGRAKTVNQVRTHFGLVVEMIRRRFEEMGVDVCGVCPNKLMIHEILKKSCGGVGDNGEILGLSEMSTAQASMFFGNCRTWGATQLQLDIPNPDRDWKTKK